MIKKTIIALLVSMAMTACGGGGGSGGSSPDPTPTPTPTPDPQPSVSKLSPVNYAKCYNESGELKEAGSTMTCFDWSKDDTEAYFKALIEKMSKEYQIDAWRFDQAYQVPLANWKNIQKSIKNGTSFSKISGFSVAEVWDGDGKQIQDRVLKDGALESAFNFPLRYKLVQVLAGQESDSAYGATMQPASGLADEWGYGNYIRYNNTSVMPTVFTDNHDIVRLGNLLFRWGFNNESSVATDKKYSLRHLLSFAFMGAYSGPVTIYYGSEYGDYTKGFSKKLDSCGSGTAWCDDHVSRTQMVSSESELAEWQVNLRKNVARIMEFRKYHPALFNGQRYHIYSTETAPSAKDAENFYVDVKKTVDGSEAYVFAMSTSESNRSLELNSDVSEYLCMKAVGSSKCTLTTVMNTSEDNVTNPTEESFGGNLVFNLPALTAKYYKVTATTTPAAAATASYTKTTATGVSGLADKFDNKINSFTCFKGENSDKCGLIIYQVMVESAPEGSDASGKGTAWGPSNHKGTLGGIESSLEFIKGSGANAIWVTPIFTTSTSSDPVQAKTDGTAYYATSHWVGDKANIDDAFGGDNSLRSLIQQVHANDMYFILDGVLGHAKSDFSKNTSYINVEN